MENTNCNCLENIIDKVNLVQDFINGKLLDITEAECSRMNNENERIKNETSRQKAECDRITNENVRQNGYNKIVELIDKFTESEKGILLNELERINTENKRLLQEKCRKDAENLRKELEDSRQTAETLRTTSEINRIESENNRIIAENRRNIAELNRHLTELIRETQENTRQNNELTRKNQENSRVLTENVRVEAENTRVQAELIRVSNEAERTNAEQVRENSEGQRVGAEQGRASAESARVTAEGEREQGFTEKAAHLEELLQYIKDNHLEVDAKLAEAIKNTIKGTDEFVYLDGSDGNVKSMPNTRSLGPSAAAVYYAGKRSVMPGERYMVIGYQTNRLIRSFDLSGWDFEAATDMRRFLLNASGLRTLTLPENMTLANVTNMSECFSECVSLQSLDTSKWTLENVTNMSDCFNRCVSLQSLDTSKWTLENVTNMSRCFNEGSSLQSLDTSKWTLENVTNMSECFSNCHNIREIDFSSCNITKCVSWDGCFAHLYRLETLRVGLIDFSPCGRIDLFVWGTNPRELTGTLRGIRNDFRAVSSRMTRDSCMVVINGLETVTEAKTLTLGVNNKPVSLGGKGSDPISDDDLKIATDKGWTVQFG